MDTADRRLALRDALINAAERAVAARGLAGLRARELAAEAGCAIGAIYNVFDDLDDLVVVVNGRTLVALEKALADAAGVKPGGASDHPDAAAKSLVTMALAYLDFAAGNAARWRALFDHRLPVGKNLPDWYLADQVKLFGYVERPLRALRPALKPAERAVLARSLFSAVHGLVTLGLEEKLGVVPLATLRKQVALVVAATGRGLAD
jgi:AcrR family transcriptional regulator